MSIRPVVYPLNKSPPGAVRRNPAETFAKGGDHNEHLEVFRYLCLLIYIIAKRDFSVPPFITG